MRSCPLRSVGNHQANRLPKADSVRLLTLVHDVAVTPEWRHVIKGNHSASYTFSKQGEHRSPNIEPRSLSLPHTETLARLHMSRSRSHKIICFLARWQQWRTFQSTIRDSNRLRISITARSIRPRRFACRFSVMSLPLAFHTFLKFLYFLASHAAH